MNERGVQVAEEETWRKTSRPLQPRQEILISREPWRKGSRVSLQLAQWIVFLLTTGYRTPKLIN